MMGIHLGYWLPALSRLLAIGGLVVLIGMLPWLSGHDPAITLLRARLGEQEATAEALSAIREALGLEAGPWVMLGHWLSGVVHGDAGVSWVSGQPVLPGLLRALGVSMTLMGAALSVALLVAALLCIAPMRAGVRGGSVSTIGGLAVVLTAVPEFLMATALLLLLAIWWPILPPFGWHGPACLVIPALAMGLPAGGLLGRLAIGMMRSAFNEHWVMTWQMAGIARRHLVMAILQRIMPGLLPQLALVVTGLTGGAIAVEKIMAIPGLGRATLGAVMAQDMPVIQTGMLLLLAVAVIASVLAEALRHRLLGSALRRQALPAPSETDMPSASSLVGCLLVSGILAIVLLTGLWRDPWSLSYPRLASPSWSIPFGADASGRDLLARLAHGMLQTCGLALIVVMGCLLIGTLVSLAPRAMSGVIDVANALPATLAGLVVAALQGPSPQGAVIAVMLVSWAPLAAHAVSLRHELEARPHVAMLPVLGIGPWARFRRHVLPGMVRPLVQHAMLRLPGAALALAGLGFLGLGVQPPAPEWGAMLASALPYIERAPWCVAAPSLALMALAILAVGLTLLRRIPA